MRSASSATSRKTKRRLKVFLLFVVLLLGILVSLETRMHIFRLKNISVEPSNILPESVIWCNVTKWQKSFWPALLVRQKSYRRQIETVYPLSCKLSVKKWGCLKLKLSLLKPEFIVCWDSKYWYVSENGKIWQVSLEENKILGGKQQTGKPVIYWSEDRISPYKIGDVSGNIADSLLPVKEIMEWYQDLQAVGWMDKIKGIKTEVKDGIHTVRVVFKRQDGTAGVSVILPDDHTNWVLLGLAVNKICANLQNLTQNDFIDATYKDKILVKNGTIDSDEINTGR